MSRVAILALCCFANIAVAAQPPASAEQEAWATIDRGLKSHNFEHRLQALTALSTIDGSNAEAVRRGTDVLKNDHDARVRAEAAWALGEMKAQSAIPALRVALDDQDGEVAFAAAKSLTDLGDPGGRKVLIAVLAGQRDADPGVMTNVIRDAQHELRHPLGLMIIGGTGAVGAIVPPAGAGLGAARRTVQMAHEKSAPARAIAAEYLAKDSDPYAVTLLEWALKDDSKLVRFNAAKALGTRADGSAIPQLVPVLQDDHTAVRTMAAASIIRLSHKPAETAKR